MNTANVTISAVPLIVTFWFTVNNNCCRYYIKTQIWWGVFVADPIWGMPNNWQRLCKWPYSNILTISNIRNF